MTEPTSSTPEFVYRFRPIKWLLGGELEKQQIYFAPPSELNDPMEGYFDVFWKGDQIVWRSLLKNYLVCLHHVYMSIRLGVETMTGADIPVFLTSDKFPTAKYGDRMSSIWDRFFSPPAISGFINVLSSGNREFRRDELFFFLRTIHVYALSVITALDGESLGPGISQDKILQGLEQITAALAKDSAARGGTVDAEFSNAAISSRLFESLNSFSAQHELANLCASPSLLAEGPRRLILFEFPRRYIDRLEHLCFPPWYTACFVSEIHNPALWAHYGVGHAGACLKFRTRSGAAGVGLRLEHIQGYSSSRDAPTRKIRGFDVLPLRRVIYDQRYPSLDFFKSLGRLPRPALFKDWYGAEAGQQSATAAELLADESGWRARYWETFEKNQTVKLPEWAYEKEHRIVLSSMLDDLNDKADRLLRFDFHDLDEIVFGMKTSTEDKVAVLQVAEAACRASNHFNLRFSQTSYSHATGRFEIHPLQLLKPSP